MRRSSALSLFGILGAVLTVGTVSARPHAASRAQGTAFAASIEGAGSARTALRSLELLPSDGSRAPLLGTVMWSPAPADLEATSQACPAETVEVEGDYCPVVEQRCLRWLDPEARLRCAEFEQLPAAARCPVKAAHKRFCIDRYEWPNKAGALPTYMTSFREAKAACESVDKRLCDDTEWTLACEGPERQPYPYGDGHIRDDRACNIDKPYIWPRPERIFDPSTRDDELARLDQREPSGARASCISPYGVRDMVGNVDEWVVNASQAGRPFAGGLKGGYWGPVRTRCRPMTTAHDESFRYYQIGFRCCRGTVASSEPSLAAR